MKTEVFDQLSLLSCHSELEADDDQASLKQDNQTKKEFVITSASLPNGKHIRLLKTLLTSACERNCFYCPFRAGRDFRRETLKPNEMALSFMSLYQAGVADGIFLSSGIIGGGIKTQDNLIATAEILREKYSFQGYIHLKIMPGAEKSQIIRSMELADRLSTNLEAPNQAYLDKLAPKKVFQEELLNALLTIEEIRRNNPPYQGWRHRWPSTTTQFVVGPAGESDLDLLQRTSDLYNGAHIKRTYFMAFKPVFDTPFECLTPTSPTRQQRLYQASFLLRDYRYIIEDLSFDTTGNLFIDKDPKSIWAQKNLSEHPLDINHADFQELIRIPGIGPTNAKKIIRLRRTHCLREVKDLRKAGIEPKRMLPYILLDGKRPEKQLLLF